MLFNSVEFIVGFLPITLLLFYLIRNNIGAKFALAFLVIASLFFYAQWNPFYLLILILSMAFNYYIGFILSKGTIHPKFVLFVGIAADLALLGYFKYANFFVQSINQLTGSSWNLGDIALPLGISFFTFQQISYRMECYYGHRKGDSLLDYCTCVTFFPHLIAGPIVLYQELIPQFHDKKKIFSRFWINFPVGVSIFIVGLFKKVIIADSLIPFVKPVFESAALGDASISFFDAWGAVLAYSFQLYFDFSGYCDMAIGLAKMFGITLPINFDSPYKANNIIDFWRKWHMTLSRFLRQYLYIPLGGNKGGVLARSRNLLITMILGGLWHGAGWGYVAWGALHGFYLIINHLFQVASPANETIYFRLRALIARPLTFLCVAIAWVPFRSADLSTTGVMIRAMSSPSTTALLSNKLDYQTLSLYLLICFGIVWLMPNTKEIFSIDNQYQLPRILVWKPNWMWAMALSVIAFICFINLSKVSEFLYFQF